MAENQVQKEIVVAGDIALDWNIINLSERRDALVWNDALPSHITWHFGGSLLLADLIANIVSRRQEAGSPWKLHRVMLKREQYSPDDERFTKSYASWGQFPLTSAPEDSKKAKVWRVKDFLGVTQCSQSGDFQLETDSSEVDIVVLDDANLGFRRNRNQWPQVITNPQPGKRPWIVVKMAKPLVHGDLWEELYRNWSDRLIIILSVKDLRLSEIQISSELSWERTAQDVAWELVYNPKVNAISRCAHVIVSFNAAGAVWMKGASGEDMPDWTLVFDPQVIEGAWENSHPGKMIGYNTCLTASIVRELILNTEKPDFMKGISGGLWALRKLHQDGYEQCAPGASKEPIAFPFTSIAQGLETCKGDAFAAVQIQSPTRLLESSPVPPDQKPFTAGFWTILQQSCTSNLESLAAQILSEGADNALSNVPLGKFGNLLTVDRREIESFRSIRMLVNEYCSQEKPKRPLSIAVFGPPGAGKSFGVTQVAKALRPNEIEDITFNLSQFGSVEDLPSAFHQVRDMNLSGKTPLVFWDEFDSVLDKEKFGWLRYFLVPMQDGKFMERQLLHPLGRAIFVFAGGVCHSIEEFVRESKQFRDAKAPDFISRLRGYVNIIGANPPEEDSDQNVSDPFYMVRRAILLRSILWMNVPHIFENRSPKGRLQIDGSVLRALLKTRIYKHGARSMEAVVNMSNLAGKSHFDQSSLPSEAQLDLHVDGQDFLACVQEIILEGTTLEKLAANNHEIYCQSMRAKGYKYGPERDDVKKTRPLLAQYAQIPEEYKESNRRAVRSVAEKLKAVGYIMIQARSNEPPFDFPGEDLEFLARMEHDRYMAAAVADGWQYGPMDDDAQRTKASLLPWEEMCDEDIEDCYPLIAAKIGRGELPEIEKAKDRTQIQGYIDVLRRAGYAIVKLRRSRL